ncbi:hypothetical protein MY4038_008275 [Beauveria bassiana]
MSKIEERQPSVCRIAIVGRAGTGKSTVSRAIRRQPIDIDYNPTPFHETEYTANRNCEIAELPSYRCLLTGRIEELPLPDAESLQDYHVVVFLYRADRPRSEIDAEWIQCFTLDDPQKPLVVVGLDARPEDTGYFCAEGYSTVAFNRNFDPSPLLSAIADLMDEEFPQAAEDIRIKNQLTFERCLSLSRLLRDYL